jgi:RNA polymerase sigma factor (sigma-70 family)
VPVEDDPVAVSTLVAAATDGDESAWNNLVERYGPLVMSVLTGYRLFRADAEDVSQIVWLRLVEHLGDLREPRALPRWLITTTRNECIRLLRARSQVEPFDPLQENGPGAVDLREPDEDMLRAERRQALLEAFAEMSDWHRALLLLLVHDPPLSYATISDRLDMPIGSIGPTRARLLTKLRSSPALAGLLESPRETVRGGGEQHDVQALAGR